MKLLKPVGFFTSNKWALVSGAGIILFGTFARLSIGGVYREQQAVRLIESLANAGLYLGSAVATASATTLALMLALLGLTKRSDNDFDAGVYRRISDISLYATLTLIMSIILLLILVMPIGEFDSMPEKWFPIMYDVLFATTVLVCATLVATITQLFSTIQLVISNVTPEREDDT